MPPHGLSPLLTALSLVLGIVAGLAPTRADEPPDATFSNRRHVYERGEVCAIELKTTAADVVHFDVSGWLPTEVPVEGGRAVYRVDTATLRAGDYTVRARLVRKDTPIKTVTFPLTVAKQHDRERLPVWRWGGGGNNLAWWTQRGFTGGFTGAVRDPVDRTDPSRIEALRRRYDEATRYDFELGMYIYPLLSTKLAGQSSLLCLRPDGSRVTKPKRRLYPLEPPVVEHAAAVAESWMALLGEYPALRHVMLCSEWQTPFCVNETAVKLARKEIGLDLRKLITDKGRIKPFDRSRIADGPIDDDNPRYRFLQWWWQRGHGVAPLNERMHAIVKRHRRDTITWHEPYRLAPVRYSHKGLDCIGTWTYGHPDIKRLCYTTYLQAAARPERQLVQQDITLFVYGRFAVPLDKSTADLSKDFAGKDPYFTAGPDYAREAIWIVLSQRPDVLCFYSAGRLSPDKPAQDPHINSPQTFDAIGQTCDALVKPYGPAILASRRLKPRTALLMSAAATWFRVGPREGGYDNEQTLPFATLLMMNHVPFDVVLDEDVAEGALDDYDVLVMPKADTLTRSMHTRIVAFAQKGGTVIAGRSLRAEVPNAVVVPFDFAHQSRISGKALAKGNAVTAEQDRKIMENYAKALAPHLKRVIRPADATSPRVLTNSLDAGDVHYHFFVNDDRTYGPRFGKWKLRFESGVPQTAAASVLADEGVALYDALRRRRIDAQREGRRSVFTLRLPGAWGALVAAVPEPIEGVKIDAPSSAAAGKPVSLKVSVLGKSGQTIRGVLPLQVRVLDPLGRRTEWDRYTATREGVCTISFIPAINDAAGRWLVRVTDLLAGTSAEHELQCPS